MIEENTPETQTREKIESNYFQKFEEGLKYLSTKDHKTGILILKSITEDDYVLKNSKDFKDLLQSCFYNLGLISKELKNFKDSIYFYYQYHRLDEENISTIFELANLCIKEGFLTESEYFFKLILSKPHTHTQKLFISEKLGLIFYFKGEVKKSIEVFNCLKEFNYNQSRIDQYLQHLTNLDQEFEQFDMFSEENQEIEDIEQGVESSRFEYVTQIIDAKKKILGKMNQTNFEIFENKKKFRERVINEGKKVVEVEVSSELNWRGLLESLITIYKINQMESRGEKDLEKKISKIRGVSQIKNFRNLDIFNCEVKISVDLNFFEEVLKQKEKIVEEIVDKSTKEEKSQAKDRETVYRDMHLRGKRSLHQEYDDTFEQSENFNSSLSRIYEFFMDGASLEFVQREMEHVFLQSKSGKSLEKRMKDRINALFANKEDESEKDTFNFVKLGINNLASIKPESSEALLLLDFINFLKKIKLEFSENLTLKIEDLTRMVLNHFLGINLHEFSYSGYEFDTRKYRGPHPLIYIEQCKLKEYCARVVKRCQEFYNNLLGYEESITMMEIYAEEILKIEREAKVKNSEAKMKLLAVRKSLAEKFSLCYKNSMNLLMEEIRLFKETNEDSNGGYLEDPKKKLKLYSLEMSKLRIQLQAINVSFLVRFDKLAPEERKAKLRKTVKKFQKLIEEQNKIYQKIAMDVDFTGSIENNTTEKVKKEVNLYWLQIGKISIENYITNSTQNINSAFQIKSKARADAKISKLLGDHFSKKYFHQFLTYGHSFSIQYSKFFSRVPEGNNDCIDYMKNFSKLLYLFIKGFSLQGRPTLEDVRETFIKLFDCLKLLEIFKSVEKTVRDDEFLGNLGFMKETHSTALIYNLSRIIIFAMFSIDYSKLKIQKMMTILVKISTRLMVPWQVFKILRLIHFLVHKNTEKSDQLHITLFNHYSRPKLFGMSLEVLKAPPNKNVSRVAVEYELLSLMRCFYGVATDNVKQQDLTTFENALPDEEIALYANFPVINNISYGNKLSIYEIQNFVELISHFFFSKIERNVGKALQDKMAMCFRQKATSNQYLNRKKYLQLNIPSRLQKGIFRFLEKAFLQIKQQQSLWLGCKGIEKLMKYPKVLDFESELIENFEEMKKMRFENEGTSAKDFTLDEIDRYSSGKSLKIGKLQDEEEKGMINLNSFFKDFRFNTQEEKSKMMKIESEQADSECSDFSESLSKQFSMISNKNGKGGLEIPGLEKSQILELMRLEREVSLEERFKEYSTDKDKIFERLEKILQMKLPSKNKDHYSLIVEFLESTQVSKRRKLVEYLLLGGEEIEYLRLLQFFDKVKTVRSSPSHCFCSTLCRHHIIHRNSISILFTLWNEIAQKDMSNLASVDYWNGILDNFEERVKRLGIKKHVARMSFLLNLVLDCPLWFFYNYIVYLDFSLEEFSIYHYLNIHKHYGKSQREKLKKMKKFENQDLDIHIELTFIMNSFLPPDITDIEAAFAMKNQKLEECVKKEIIEKKKKLFSRSLFEGFISNELTEYQMIFLAVRIESIENEIETNKLLMERMINLIESEDQLSVKLKQIKYVLDVKLKDSFSKHLGVEFGVTGDSELQKTVEKYCTQLKDKIMFMKRLKEKITEFFDLVFYEHRAKTFRLDFVGLMYEIRFNDWEVSIRRILNVSEKFERLDRFEEKSLPIQFYMNNFRTNYDVYKVEIEVLKNQYFLKTVKNVFELLMNQLSFRHRSDILQMNNQEKNQILESKKNLEIEEEKAIYFEEMTLMINFAEDAISKIKHLITMHPPLIDGFNNFQIEGTKLFTFERFSSKILTSFSNDELDLDEKLSIDLIAKKFKLSEYFLEKHRLMKEIDMFLNKRNLVIRVRKLLEEAFVLVEKSMRYLHSLIQLSKNKHKDKHYFINSVLTLAENTQNFFGVVQKSSHYLYKKNPKINIYERLAKKFNANLVGNYFFKHYDLSLKFENDLKMNLVTLNPIYTNNLRRRIINITDDESTSTYSYLRKIDKMYKKNQNPLYACYFFRGMNETMRSLMTLFEKGLDEDLQLFENALNEEVLVLKNFFQKFITFAKKGDNLLNKRVLDIYKMKVLGGEIKGKISEGEDEMIKILNLHQYETFAKLTNLYSFRIIYRWRWIKKLEELVLKKIADDAQKKEILDLKEKKRFEYIMKNFKNIGENEDFKKFLVEWSTSYHTEYIQLICSTFTSRYFIQFEDKLRISKPFVKNPIRFFETYDKMKKKYVYSDKKIRVSKSKKGMEDDTNTEDDEELEKIPIEIKSIEKGDLEVDKPVEKPVEIPVEKPAVKVAKSEKKKKVKKKQTKGNVVGLKFLGAKGSKTTEKKKTTKKKGGMKAKSAAKKKGGMRAKSAAKKKKVKKTAAKKKGGMRAKSAAKKKKVKKTAAKKQKKSEKKSAAKKE